MQVDRVYRPLAGGPNIIIWEGGREWLQRKKKAQATHTDFGYTLIDKDGRHQSWSEERHILGGSIGQPANAFERRAKKKPTIHITNISAAFFYRGKLRLDILKNN